MKMSQLMSADRRAASGIWREYGGGLRLKIAPLGNKGYDEEIRKLTREDLKAIRRGDDARVEAAVKTAMSRHVLVGWEGLTDDDGQPVPYSHEKALELLRGSYEFFKDIQRIAAELAGEKAALMEDSEGNSATACAGN